MDDDGKKYLGFVIIFLEVLLSGCLVLLAFIYGIWVTDAEYTGKILISNKWIEATKRQIIVTISGLLASWLIHSLNTYWISRTGMGSLKNSYVFARGVFIMIFLAGLAGLFFFLFPLPGKL